MELRNKKGNIIGHLFFDTKGCYPIKVNKNIIGYLNIPEEESFTEDDEELFTEDEEEHITSNKRKRQNINVDEGPPQKKIKTRKMIQIDFRLYCANNKEIINDEWCKLYPDKESMHKMTKASYFWKQMTDSEKRNTIFPQRLFSN